MAIEYSEEYDWLKRSNLLPCYTAKTPLALFTIVPRTQAFYVLNLVSYLADVDCFYLFFPFSNIEKEK